jgi:multidrug efflux pump subunit AcrB
MAAIEEFAARLPAGIGLSWTGLSCEERLVGSQAPMLYVLSIVVVFLALSALYESRSLPFSVMLVVPLGILAAVLATRLRGLENDVYFQVGLLTTVGLAAKNAIGGMLSATLVSSFFVPLFFVLVNRYPADSHHPVQPGSLPLAGLWLIRPATQR